MYFVSVTMAGSIRWHEPFATPMNLHPSLDYYGVHFTQGPSDSRHLVIHLA